MSAKKTKQNKPAEGELKLETEEDSVDTNADIVKKEKILTVLDVPADIVASIEKRFPCVQSFKAEDGHDYFAGENLPLLTKIIDMHYRQGFTLKGVQNFLDTQGISSEKKTKKTKGSKKKKDAAPAQTVEVQGELSIEPEAERQQSLEDIGRRMEDILARIATL